MSPEADDWLPHLIELSECGGDPTAFLERIYKSFLDDFVTGKTYFNGMRVVTRREPEVNGKYGGFWHLISNEDTQRAPDTLDRHKRIRWPKAILEHSTDPRILIWENANYKGSSNHGKRSRIKLWFNEEYLVVIEPGRNVYHLITAFTTDYPHTRRKLHKEYTEYQDAVKKAEAEQDTSVPTSDSPSTPRR